MADRVELQYLLEDILGSRNVYFQPPPSVRLQYPAIVYSRTSIDNLSANDRVYKQDTAYEVVVIEHDPDSKIVYDISKLPMCRHLRHYVEDNLYHDAFRIYY